MLNILDELYLRRTRIRIVIIFVFLKYSNSKIISLKSSGQATVLSGRHPMIQCARALLESIFSAYKMSLWAKNDLEDRRHDA